MNRSLIAAGALIAAGLVTGIVLYAQTAPTSAPANVPEPKIPPNEPGNQGNGQASKDFIKKSTRHQEWVDIKIAGSDKPLHTWVVYPERPDKAPVVLVIMEIYGMTDWVEATTDQVAADGFIAVAPDFTSLKGTMPNGLKSDEVVADLNAARDWALGQPSANGKSACVGFCWGGNQSFAYAVAQPKLDAAVTFYGQPPMTGQPAKPDEAQLAKIVCPVMSFYGGSDQRVTATAQPATDAMKKLNKSFEAHIYDGAAHGFMRQQNAAGSPNSKAAQTAWPLAVKFLTEHTKADAPK